MYLTNPNGKRASETMRKKAPSSFVHLQTLSFPMSRLVREKSSSIQYKRKEKALCPSFLYIGSLVGADSAALFVQTRTSQRSQRSHPLHCIAIAIAIGICITWPLTVQSRRESQSGDSPTCYSKQFLNNSRDMKIGSARAWHIYDTN